MREENLRVMITKRMLREGLFRCLKRIRLDKLTVSELCKESHVNRATFYNHYDTPRDILSEIGWEYAEEVKKIFTETSDKSIRDRLEESIDVLYKYKDEIKIIFVNGADANMTRAVSEIYMWLWQQVGRELIRLNDLDDVGRELIGTSIGWGSFHLIMKWLTEDIEKTPGEIADMVMSVMQSVI